MPEKIPFSVGLSALPTELLNNGSPTSNSGWSLNGGVGTNQGNGLFFSGSNVSLGNIEKIGNFIKDAELKQAYIPMTVFQSFPVKMPDGTYTMVSDHTSTCDGAGTNKGGLACKLNAGTCGCPDGFDISILNSMQGKVPNFKVGASCSSKFGQSYLQFFYPEVKWGAKDFCRLKYNLYICAELVCPISATEGKVMRIKMVDEGPVHKDAIDLMGAFCLLTPYADTFSIYGKINGKNQTIDNSTYQFAFKDNGYDYVNGEIPGYNPEAMIALKNSVKVTTAFSRYGGSAKGGERGQNGNSMVRVRFFIDPSQREGAEKLVGHPLPDDLFKTNYTGETATLTQPIMASTGNYDSSTIAGMILNSGLKVSEYCRANHLQYYSAGNKRTLLASTINNLKIIPSDCVDCSLGIWWMMGEAGLLKNPAGSPPNTTYYRRNFTSDLAPGLSVVEVQESQLQPGDILFWDRNRDSMNHVAIYAGPGKCFDFGSTTRINSPQPVNKGLKDSRGGKLRIWRIVANSNETNATIA